MSLLHTPGVFFKNSNDPDSVFDICVKSGDLSNALFFTEMPPGVCDRVDTLVLTGSCFKFDGKLGHPEWMLEKIRFLVINVESMSGIGAFRGFWNLETVMITGLTAIIEEMFIA